MATTDNLWAAFAGESQANRKYLAFAKKADDDGYPQIAKLFRAAAEAETVHAHAHLRALGEIKTTLKNLEGAVEGETYEFEQMYPPFIDQAKAEGNKQAETSFRFANAVEKVHADLYQEALDTLKGGKDLDVHAIFVCGVCGNTVKHEAPEKCPVCGAPKKMFREIQ